MQTTDFRSKVSSGLRWMVAAAIHTTGSKIEARKKKALPTADSSEARSQLCIRLNLSIEPEARTACHATRRGSRRTTAVPSRDVAQPNIFESL
mmetsp:Transcript_7631/g.15703  ORF Transcript_7631/g.15703 Transcript_7631/m.15703 type:complete len:93 (-) Transcript_7631:149-427(-)